MSFNFCLLMGNYFVKFLPNLISLGISVVPLIYRFMFISGVVLPFDVVQALFDFNLDYPFLLNWCSISKLLLILFSWFLFGFALSCEFSSLILMRPKTSKVVHMTVFQLL